MTTASDNRRGAPLSAVAGVLSEPKYTLVCGRCGNVHKDGLRGIERCWRWDLRDSWLKEKEQ